MERRLEERTPTKVLLSCRIPASPRTVTMHDVSHHGCRLELPDSHIELGGTVLIDLPGAARFPGLVIWKHRKFAGIRFPRRLTAGAAIALGLDDPEPPQVATGPVEAEAPSGLPGLLRHWIRRLTSRAS